MCFKIKKRKALCYISVGKSHDSSCTQPVTPPPVTKIRFFTFLNACGSRKKSFNCVQVSETPPSICLSCLQQTWEPSLISAFSTCSPKTPQIWVLHPCPAMICTHQAAQPRRRRAFLFPAPSQLLAGYLITGSWSSSQALPQHQQPQSTADKKASEQLRKKWFEKPEGWSRAGDARGTWGRQPWPEPPPHQVQQYFVVDRSKFSQSKARTHRKFFPACFRC